MYDPLITGVAADLAYTLARTPTFSLQSDDAHFRSEKPLKPPRFGSRVLYFNGAVRLVSPDRRTERSSWKIAGHMTRLRTSTFYYGPPQGAASVLS